MTAQETNLFNAFETTLTATMGSSDTTFSVNAVTDSYPTTLSAPFYIVINPDSATNREVILVTAVDTGTKQLTTTVYQIGTYKVQQLVQVFHIHQVKLFVWLHYNNI